MEKKTIAIIAAAVTAVVATVTAVVLGRRNHANAGEGVSELVENATETAIEVAKED